MIFEFENCVLDMDRHELRRDGEIVHIEPQVFDILALFARDPKVLFSRDQLIEHVWQGVLVSESAISARISAARTALGDNGRKQAFIRTVSRKGYQFVPAVKIRPQKSNDKPGFEKPIKPSIRFARTSDGLNIAFATSGTGPPLILAGHLSPIPVPLKGFQFLPHRKPDQLR